VSILPALNVSERDYNGRKSVRDLFNQIDALLEIHSEVDELPLDAFLLVLLLFQDEHVMVEELLQTLVRVVDAQLLEGVVL